LDGRDIGTVICPEAEAKLFVTASVEERARRRHSELMEQGDMRSLAQVLTDVQERDARDRDRAHAPMKPADDAILIDTSDLTIEDATARAIAAVKSLMS
ncbi:MAG: (d)CMP kinase, partial [Pseudomonadota bacterium]